MKALLVTVSDPWRSVTGTARACCAEYQPAASGADDFRGRCDCHDSFEARFFENLPRLAVEC